MLNKLSYSSIFPKFLLFYQNLTYFSSLFLASYFSKISVVAGIPYVNILGVLPGN